MEVDAEIGLGAGRIDLVGKPEVAKSGLSRSKRGTIVRSR